MKKFLNIFLMIFIVLSLSSCGGGDGDSFDDNYNNSSYDNDSYDNDNYNYNNNESVHLSELSDGYTISGVSSQGEDVDIYFYSDGSYEYDRGNDSFYGRYSIVDTEVQFKDDDGGSYVLDSENYIFETNKNYHCTGGYSSSLYITSITAN
jgi:hypothetical protein